MKNKRYESGMIAAVCLILAGVCVAVAALAQLLGVAL